MKYVYDGIPEHEARLCFAGEKIPIYMMTKDDIFEYTKPEPALSREEQERLEKLSWKIADLNLTNRSRNICLRNGIVTLGDLVALTATQFARFRNAGATTIADVKNMLETYGLSFKEEPVELQYRLPREGSDYDYYMRSDV